MISTDDKLMRNRFNSYKHITEPEKKEEKKKDKSLFSYDDFAHDDFFFGTCVPYKKSSDIEYNIKVNH